MDEQSEGAAGSELAQALGAWGAAFELERWVLVMRGVGSQVTPLALEVDGAGVLCVFSSPENAAAFTEEVLATHAADSGQMAVPVADAIEYLMGFAEVGVRAVVLDPGTQDAAALLSALPHLRALAREASGAPGEPGADSPQPEV